MIGLGSDKKVLSIAFTVTLKPLFTLQNKLFSPSFIRFSWIRSQNQTIAIAMHFCQQKWFNQLSWFCLPLLWPRLPQIQSWIWRKPLLLQNSRSLAVKMKQDFLLYFMPINHSLYRNVILRTFDKLGNIDTHRYNLPFAELSTLELWFAARMPWLVLGASVFGTKIPSTKRVIIS